MQSRAGRDGVGRGGTAVPPPSSAADVVGEHGHRPDREEEVIARPRGEEAVHHRGGQLPRQQQRLAAVPARGPRCYHASPRSALQCELPCAGHNIVHGHCCPWTVRQPTAVENGRAGLVCARRSESAPASGSVKNLRPG
jgi:hypothetical protein